MPAWFVGLTAIVSLAAGAAASVVGFGIGSLLTPLLAARLGADVAIAAVSLPHLAAGLLRGWQLRRSINASVLVRFGLLSALGGLLGAFAFSRLETPVLTRALGALLVLTATAGLTGWAVKWNPERGVAWLLGVLSGFFGGVVGNQGGMRAAALSGFRLEPAEFVATSTVVGVLIDIARTPVYMSETGGSVAGIWGWWWRRLPAF
jgi:uncharacterized protein